MQRKWALIVAVILGLLAVFLTNVYFRQKEARLRVTEVKVLVAARDISKGATVDYNMVAFKMMPLSFVQPRALDSKEAAVGKTAAVTIAAGEQIQATKLVTPKTGLTLAMKTPPGKRAFTIGLGSDATVGGMVKPSDHVDIIATFDAPAITITLFQDVLILAVGQEMVPSARASRGSGAAAGKTDVTLALSPQEVQILTVAMKAGQIMMTLRPQMETGKAVDSVNLSNLPPVIDFNTLLQLYIRRPPTKPQTNVEVIRGLEKQFTPIPEGK